MAGHSWSSHLKFKMIYDFFQKNGILKIGGRMKTHIALTCPKRRKMSSQIVTRIYCYLKKGGQIKPAIFITSKKYSWFSSWFQVNISEGSFLFRELFTFDCTSQRKKTGNIILLTLEATFEFY